MNSITLSANMVYIFSGIAALFIVVSYLLGKHHKNKGWKSILSSGIAQEDFFPDSNYENYNPGLVGACRFEAAVEIIFICSPKNPTVNLIPGTTKKAGFIRGTEPSRFKTYAEANKNGILGFNMTTYPGPD